MSRRASLGRTGWWFFCQSAQGGSGSGTTTLIVPIPGHVDEEHDDDDDDVSILVPKISNPSLSTTLSGTLGPDFITLGRYCIFVDYNQKVFWIDMIHRYPYLTRSKR